MEKNHIEKSFKAFYTDILSEESNPVIIQRYNTFLSTLDFVYFCRCVSSCMPHLMSERKTSFTARSLVIDFILKNTKLEKQHFTFLYNMVCWAVYDANEKNNISRYQNLLEILIQFLPHELIEKAIYYNPAQSITKAILNNTQWRTLLPVLFKRGVNLSEIEGTNCVLFILREIEKDKLEKIQYLTELGVDIEKTVVSNLWSHLLIEYWDTDNISDMQFFLKLGISSNYTGSMPSLVHFVVDGELDEKKRAWFIEYSLSNPTNSHLLNHYNIKSAADMLVSNSNYYLLKPYIDLDLGWRGDDKENSSFNFLHAASEETRNKFLKAVFELSEYATVLPFLPDLKTENNECLRALIDTHVHTVHKYEHEKAVANWLSQGKEKAQEILKHFYDKCYLSEDAYQLALHILTCLYYMSEQEQLEFNNNQSMEFFFMQFLSFSGFIKFSSKQDLPPDCVSFFKEYIAKFPYDKKVAHKDNQEAHENIYGQFEKIFPKNQPVIEYNNLSHTLFYQHFYQWLGLQEADFFNDISNLVASIFNEKYPAENLTAIEETIAVFREALADDEDIEDDEDDDDIDEDIRINIFASAKDDTTDTTEETPVSEKPIEVFLYTEEGLKRFKSACEENKKDGHEKYADKFLEKLNKNPRMRYKTLARASTLLHDLDSLYEKFPHFSQVLEHLSNYALLQSKGDGVFYIPPLLMAGGPGVGKTFFSHELAQVVKTFFYVFNMESMSNSGILTGLGDLWSGATPGKIFSTLRDEDNINPIFLLDEIDKCGGDDRFSPTNSLLPLLEKYTASKFTDECIPLEIDASHVVWFATANNLDSVSAPLKSRFDIFHIPSPNFSERKCLIKGVYQSILKNNSWGSIFSETIPEATLDLLASVSTPGAARDLRRNLTVACSKAARANRNELLPEDLSMLAQGEKMVWDIVKDGTY